MIFTQQKGIDVNTGKLASRVLYSSVVFRVKRKKTLLYPMISTDIQLQKKNITRNAPPPPPPPSINVIDISLSSEQSLPGHN